MTIQHTQDDNMNEATEETTTAPQEPHKPGFLEKVKDLFDPSDGSEPHVGKHTMEDWEVSTLEGGADQGPH